MAEAAWIGGRIREMREARGWSRTDLAEAAGVSMRAVTQWERNEREPSWGNVLALAEALGVTCEAFTKPPTRKVRPGRRRPAKMVAEAPAAKRPRKAAEVRIGKNKAKAK
jgi:transcriptional regulator with XRE-family HTH domain